MKAAKFIVTLFLVGLAMPLTGCGDRYQEGYRAGLRRAASYFDAELFDLQDWVEKNGGRDLTITPATGGEWLDDTPHQEAQASWRKGGYLVQIGLSNGRVELYKVSPVFLVFGEKVVLVDSWNSPGLASGILYVPDGDGYAVSVDIRDKVMPAADAAVDRLMAAETGD